jgi:FYVE zinc finger
MLPVLCGLYGLPVSPAPTAIEIGLKFEARLVKGWLPSKGRLEHDWELAEREAVLEIGYEHMWVRINGVRTVETWVNKSLINTCTWCNRTLLVGARRHCRVCGRIFCQDCASQTEAVALPALEPGQPVPLAGAQLRVCDTCYTGAH